ncbi:MAG: flotillin family protein, partial [Putridiphycobacter sp.]
FKAMQKLIDAEAEQKSSVQKADAIKTLAEAKASEFAATGIAEAQVMEAKAAATEKQGDADAHIIEAKAEAEAKGIELKGLANAQTELKIGLAKVDVEKNKGFVEAEIIEAKAKSVETKGLAEAKVDSEKYKAEAQGILEKAEAMKKLDGVGKEHEEFKLELEKQKEIDLAQINIQKDIASAQADVLAEALKSANIDIVGGEQEFFDRITGSITKGKTLERTISSSDTLSKVKAQLLDNVEGKTFIDKIKTLIADSNLKSEDIKNVTISALLAKMMASSKDNKQKGLIEHVMYLVKEFGLDNLSTDSLDM